jgi:hypothetical protein
LNGVSSLPPLTKYALFSLNGAYVRTSDGHFKEMGEEVTRVQYLMTNGAKVLSNVSVTGINNMDFTWMAYK